MYGGARGGGKSYGVLLDWLAHQERNGSDAAGFIFRRTYPELENIIDKSREIFGPYGARFLNAARTWVFPNGSKLKLRHLDRDEHADEYQGHETNYIGFDEAGHWPTPIAIDKMRACLRSSAGVKPRMVLTSNPGGPGHNWLKRRFVDPVPPLTLQWIRDDWSRVFIPSRVQDNRALMRAQPGYLDQIRDSGPPWLVKAWLEGDWNIVAGGALDDLWSSESHVLAPFRIPDNWRIDRSFDWGSSAPFSVLWWAESNGEEFEDADHHAAWVPKGTLFLIAEWYGANDRGEGLKLTNSAIAEGILKTEASLPITQRVRPGPADNSIFDVVNGTSIADEMERVGVRWERSDKRKGSRINGLELVRSRLKAALDEPMERAGLFIFETNRHFISHVPMVQRDPKNPEDVDSEGEDHDYDAARYRIVQTVRLAEARPIAGMY